MNEPTRLSDHVVHLTDELGITVFPRNDELWVARDRPELTTGRLVSIFSYDGTWDYQERHPTCAELVYVITGAVDLLVDTGAGERARHVPAGGVGVVPAGGWHRLAVHEPCSVLFITPTPAQTEHRAAPVRSSVPA
jgi:mannose-6-phosphate isomerase-like protein (cupin superfamily)